MLNSMLIRHIVYFDRVTLNKFKQINRRESIDYEPIHKQHFEKKKNFFRILFLFDLNKKITKNKLKINIDIVND